MNSPKIEPTELGRIHTALQLREQSYQLQTHLTRGEPTEDDDDGIKVQALLQLLVKHKWPLLAAVVLCVGAAVVSGLTAVPIYQAAATLQIDRATARIVSFNKDVDPYQDDDYLMLQTQYELLQSRALAERVIDEMQLDPARAQGRVVGVEPGALVGAETRAGAEATAANGEPQTGWIDSVVAGYQRLGKPSVQDREFLGRELVVGRFMGAMKIEPVRNSRLVRIKVAGANAVQTARVANAIAYGFIGLSMERRTQSSSYAKSFLEDQLRTTKARLEASERALNTYAKNNAILTLDEKTSVINQTFTDYSAALSRVEQERVKAEALYNVMLDNPETAAFTYENRSGAIHIFKEQKARLEAEYAANLALYKPEFPKMVQLKTQIGEVDANLKTELKTILQTIKGQYEAAKKQEDEIRSKLKGTRGEVLQTQDKSVDMNLLKRELDTNRQLYDGLLQRLKEVGVTSGVANNNISVVDEANTPLYPISPNLMKNAGIGLLAGLLLGAGLIYLREHLDDSVKHADDVQGKLGLPLLGIIPQMRKKQQTVALGLLTVEEPRGVFAEAYRSMRTALQFSTPEGAPRRVMVTSSVQGEGKSTTALALAINLAQLGQRVLLIDADMRNPSLHKALARDNDSGLSSYLSSDTGGEASIQKTSVPNLAVVTAGPHPPNPVDLLMGPRFLELLERAEGLGFEKIVIDAPPTLAIADAIVLGNQVQNILFAVKAGSTRMSGIRDALRRMRLGGLMPLGVVLTNATSEHSPYYGYGYGYGAYVPPPEADKRLANVASASQVPVPISASTQASA